MPATRILPSLSPLRNRPNVAMRSLPELITEPAANSRESRVTNHQSPVTTHLLPQLHLYYHVLFRTHGPQYWWPGRTRFEIIVGAILTQNTSWSNVERAIRALRREKLLTPLALEHLDTNHLAQLIRSSGYFRQKARKLKAFVRFLREDYQGSLNKLFATPTSQLRQQLLAVHGIGPETADSILLYAGRHKVFVVDAYTRRILERHALLHPKAAYEEIRELFERSLPSDAALYNEYHALIVHTGKHFCRSRQPDCARCPLSPFLPAAEAPFFASKPLSTPAGSPTRHQSLTGHAPQVTNHGKRP